MSLTERINEIALECFDELQISIRPKDAIAATELFLSRIREEQEAWWAYRIYDPYTDNVAYRHTNDKELAFESDIGAFQIFTIPPASDPKEHDCKELVEVLEIIKNGEIYPKQIAIEALAKHKASMEGK